MTSDPIADMLTRVRNAMQARHPKVDVPASKLKAEIARILKEEGYIANFKVAEEGVKKIIKIYLKYSSGNEPVISAIERVSRPGCETHSRPATRRWMFRLRSSRPRSRASSKRKAILPTSRLPKKASRKSLRSI